MESENKLAMIFFYHKGGNVVKRFLRIEPPRPQSFFLTVFIRWLFFDLDCGDLGEMGFRP